MTATFNFDSAHSVQRESTSTFTPYPTLQAAYDAAALNGDTIKAWVITYPEFLKLDQGKFISIKGGYNQNYTAITGMTTILGGVTLATGTTIVDSIAIR